MDVIGAFVLSHLPPAPARVLELGCGPEGGLARSLLAAGHEVVAVDPVAPDGAIFRRLRFEDFVEPGPFDAVVASRSLHHVDDLAATLDHVAALLEPAGTLVLAEFAWDRLDEPTAEWYHGQLLALSAALGRAAPGSVDDVRAKWQAEHAGLHGYGAMRRELDARFAERLFTWEPHLYREVDGVATEALERTLMEAGAIRGLGFHYVGVPL
jgi:SAM-dependent methyltransferase